MKSVLQESYWYLTTTYECPVCGGFYKERERRYTPKPLYLTDRYRNIQAYDYCEEQGK